MELNEILKNTPRHPIQDNLNAIENAFMASAFVLDLEGYGYSKCTEDSISDNEGDFIQVKCADRKDLILFRYNKDFFDRLLCVYQTSDYQDARVYITPEKEGLEDIFLFSFKMVARLNAENDLEQNIEITYSPKVAYKMLVSGFKVLPFFYDGVCLNNSK